MNQSSSNSELKWVLKQVATVLNREKITWGIGASCLLDYYHILEKPPRDVDILIKLSDAEHADVILSGLGKKQVWEASEKYATKYFLEYVIDGVEIDAMAGMTIVRNKFHYTYPFDERGICGYWNLDGIEIPLTSLSDWYVLYLMMGREARAEQISDYLKGIKTRELNLIKVEDLPNEIIGQVEGFMKGEAFND